MDKTMVQDGTIRIGKDAVLEVRTGRAVLKFTCHAYCDYCQGYGDHIIKLSESELEALREELNR